MCTVLFRRPPYSCLPLLATVLLAAAASRAGAQALVDSRLAFETVAQLPPYEPVSLAWAPDGRLFIGQRSGVVRIVQNGTLLAQPFLDIRGRVNVAGDRGMLGLALDPAFAANGYVYVFYVYEEGTDPSSTGPKTGRLTRFTADPANPNRALAGSERTILGTVNTPLCSGLPANADCIPFDTPNHGADSLRFAPDGSLLVSLGEGAQFSGDTPRSLDSQRLDRYGGKILRISRDGQALADNPFYDGTNSIRSKVYAYGLRNPFRFSLDPATGEPIIGDVGQGTYEEVNLGSGRNFGWPCYEGPDVRAVFASAPECQAATPGTVTFGALTYPHSEGQAVVGGPVYDGDVYPAEYHDQYFFADYSAGWIKRATLDAAGRLVSVQPFASAMGGPVALEVGPDGLLYCVSFGSGSVRRVVYAQGAAPQPVATATPSSGYSPLAVQFSSAGSRSPSGSALTYRWDFGDGGTSTAANPTHTYTASGVASFTALLTATDAQGRTGTAQARVVVGSRPPTVTITAPLPGAPVNNGQTVSYSGAASDPDQSLPESAFRWQVLLHHDTHVHPWVESTGRNGSFPVEPHQAGGGSARYWFELILTVTDASGLVASKSVSTADVTAAPAGQAVYRINVGGGAFTDSSGQLWSADVRYNTGVASGSTPVSGPDGPLYTTQRWDPPAAPELEYALPVAAGRYLVTLLFAETWGGAASVGARVFDVLLEGQTVLPRLDVYAQAGFATPLSKTFTVDVSDGTLNVGFRHVTENPTVSGIAVVQDSGAPPPPPPPPPGATTVRINAGGPAYTDSQGRAWVADTGFNTGSVSTSSAVTGTDAALYNDQRWDPGTSPELAYAIPVSAGRYRVNLHLAESYSGAARVGGRVFDVRLEGQPALDDVDVFAEAGFGQKLVRSAVVDVTDGTLDVAFVHAVENPTVAAIEVVPEGTAPPPPAGLPLRINAGGPAFTDAQGQAWEADRGFNTGTASSSSAYTGPNAALYGRQRYDPGTSPELVYELALPDGGYTVRLHFAETYSPAARVGGRLFDVSLEGTKVLDRFDIFAEAGYLAPIVKTFGVQVADGKLTIAFAHVAENPTLAGIEVLAASAPPPPAAAVRVNCGGAAFTDSQGRAWEADRNFNTGVATTSGGYSAPDAALYGNERWDPPEGPDLVYSFPVAAGTYEVKLHFAEIYAGAAAVGRRVFDVSIEGTKVLDGLDVYAQAGYLAPLVRTFTPSVTDGALTIAFTRRVENPKINGIEFVRLP
jgi:glucose/arabinose dehydrogenase/PKD repeat protein